MNVESCKQNCEERENSLFSDFSRLCKVPKCPDICMPPNIRVGYYDGIVLYCDDNVTEAERFCEYINTEIHLNENERAKIVLYDCPELTSLSHLKLKNLDMALERCNYIFVLITKEFLKDKVMELLSSECLLKVINNEEQRWRVIPVYTESVLRKSDEIPMGFNSLVGLNYYQGKSVVGKRIKLLLEDRLHFRKANELNHQERQVHWVQEHKHGISNVCDITGADVTINNEPGSLLSGQDGVICVIKNYAYIKSNLSKRNGIAIADWLSRRKYISCDQFERIRDDSRPRRHVVDALLKTIILPSPDLVKRFFEALKSFSPEIAGELARTNLTLNEKSRFKLVTERSIRIPNASPRPPIGDDIDDWDIRFFQHYHCDSPDIVDFMNDTMLSQFHFSTSDHSRVMQCEKVRDQICELFRRMRRYGVDYVSEMSTVLEKTLYSDWVEHRRTAVTPDRLEPLRTWINDTWSTMCARFQHLQIRFIQALRGSIILQFKVEDGFAIDALSPESIHEQIEDLLRKGCIETKSEIKGHVLVTAYIMSPCDGGQDEIHVYLDFSARENMLDSKAEMMYYEKKVMSEELDPMEVKFWMAKQPKLGDTAMRMIEDKMSKSDASRKATMEALLDCIYDLENGRELLKMFCKASDPYIYKEVFSKPNQLSSAMSSHKQESALPYRQKGGLQYLFSFKMNITTICTNNRLLKVLQILNLTEKYPGRLSREDMYQITKCSLFDQLPKCQEELASYFIHKIARYDYTAREFCILSEYKQSSTLQTPSTSNYRQKMNKRAEEQRKLDLSPLDIIIAVFLCSDDICRQDLASHMWSCRLAIPFVIQEMEPPILPLCFLWPMRNIVMKWEKQHEGNITVREGRLVKESFTSIAFIRVGELRLSKSALINSVIRTTEKKHSIFFHRDCPGSTKHRYLVDGLIDISWYFPTPKSEGKITDHFEDPVTFLNLHGDEYQFQNYLPVLSRFANIVTVLSKVEYLDRCRNIIKPCIDMGKTVLVILTDQHIKDSDDATIDNFTENLKAAANQLEYLEVVDKQRAQLVKETRSVLMKLVKGKSVCLETACCSGTDISVDENVHDFRNTKKEAQAISTLLRSTQHKERNHSFLPLQDIPWRNWAAADKERLRTTYKKKNEKFQNYKAERETVMKQCRLEQLAILKKGEKRGLVDMFLNSISTPNSTNRQLFLRWLKFEIDDLSREDISPVYQNYHEIMQSLARAEESQKEKLKCRLEKLDNEVASRSFGLEHIMREIGQIYEVLHEEGNQHLLMNHDLPELAAKILLDGYPIEILDGYVNAVPIQWVRDTLRKLDIILEEKHKRSARIKVITTLGIQSSGKSTMLNALFGCQYAVSAGRCTRGVYCQLIKVEETYSEELGIDYVLAIDTEGLRAPELSASGQMIKHDNELSTFVIGLGDLTILNLMGENTTYLDDLLPISVHAFLRMEIATNLRPKCIIVHQNVNKEDKQKLLHQGRKLKETLDKMTQIVCEVERMNLKSFKDIIEFDVGKDVCYLPAILEGSQPMAPISRRYCEELNFLKQNLVKKESEKSINTLATFIKHLEDIWYAIKRDDFVYQFRNTIETEARSKLDEYWCNANWKFRQPIHHILSTGYIKIQNTKDVNELETVVKTLKSTLREVIANEHSQQKDAFATFMDEADTLMKETMTKWSVDMDKRFDDLNNELCREISEKLGEMKQDRIRKFSLKDHKSKYQDKLRKNIEQLVQSVKSSKQKSLTEVKILHLFEDYWKRWKSKLLDESPTCKTNIDIENDAYDALSTAFTSGLDALKQYVQEKRLSSYDVEDFQVKDLLTKPPSWKEKLGQLWREKFGFWDNTEIIRLKTTLFFKVKGKMDSREALFQPYSKEDIEDVVQHVKDHFQDNRKLIPLQPKHEVYLAVLVCGHAIKRLQKLHEKYVSENSLENMLDKEKEHCLRIFKALCNETETVDLLVTECREILRNGILQKLTQTLPDMIELDLRCNPFTLTSKELAIRDLMINLARQESYEKFQLFILDPHRSITHHICKCIDRYANQPKKPIEVNFGIKLETIKDQVGHALQKSFATRTNFQTWLQNFCMETKDVIVTENIDRLDELGKGRTFDLEVFFRKVLQCLKSIIQEIKDEVTSYIDENFPSMKKVVMERILKNIIGCTEGCPFCGAICLVASPVHQGQHFTTLHRPEGCIGRYYEPNRELAINTCPEAVSSANERFSYYQNGVKKWCDYATYTDVYPSWKISTDATGEETSFWNCFYAKYAVNIAGDDIKVPDIPASWKLLEWKTEIQKLQNKMK